MIGIAHSLVASVDEHLGICALVEIGVSLTDVGVLNRFNHKTSPPPQVLNGGGPL